MPLLDHFHPPLYPHHHWESFPFQLGHAQYTSRAASQPCCPRSLQVEEHTQAGTEIEIDVAAFQEQGPCPAIASAGLALATTKTAAYAPPLPDHTFPAVFPDTFEIRVFSTTAGLTLVGAIELVSPGNKDRPAQRLAFVTKCQSYLAQGISLIVMDVVTNRRVEPS